mmetsp:Transcript_39058/g.110620  ORF Transcript_39058/g.110620 Transcript_39058/m.110620 type:complete len:212 (+) Transcript_39058:1699-2334(+)
MLVPVHRRVADDGVGYKGLSWDPLPLAIRVRPRGRRVAREDDVTHHLYLCREPFNGLQGVRDELPACLHHELRKDSRVAGQGVELQPRFLLDELPVGSVGGDAHTVARSLQVLAEGAEGRHVAVGAHHHDADVEAGGVELSLVHHPHHLLVGLVVVQRGRHSLLEVSVVEVCEGVVAQLGEQEAVLVVYGVGGELGFICADRACDAKLATG